MTVARLAATGRPLAQQFTKRAAIFNWACDLLLSAQALSVKKLISPQQTVQLGNKSLQNPKGWLRRGGLGPTTQEFEFFMHLGSGNSIYLTKELVTCADS